MKRVPRLRECVLLIFLALDRLFGSVTGRPPASGQPVLAPFSRHCGRAPTLKCGLKTLRLGNTGSALIQQPGTVKTASSDDSCHALDFLHAPRPSSDNAPIVRHHDILETSPMSKSAAITQTFWPPWPFSMLNRSIRPLSDDYLVELNPSAALIVWRFTKSSTQFGVRTLQEVGSQLWFHSPPALPPLVLYAFFPRRPTTAALSSTATMTNALEPTWQYPLQIPLWYSPLIRHAIVLGTGLALVSWAHAEWHRNRQLTPLPLVYRDINRALLPPFLPDQVWTRSIQPAPKSGKGGTDGTRFQTICKRLSVPRLISKWQMTREQSKAERHNARRLAIYNELVTQRSAARSHEKRAKVSAKLKAQEPTSVHSQRFIGWNWNPFVLWRRYSNHERLKKNQFDYADPLGYALVTGASSGIGRAIAVELARWKIPLILVARDVNALTELAIDLEACYGVDCCILSADLSHPDTADHIYEAVTDAGLNVDVLVNNAGISSHGESLDLPLNQVESMIQVNAMSVSKLTHFFGRDMKQRHRGRILIVSSICGAVDGIATVAVYSATKAFENSLGVSIGKELEPYGVGLTCLLPGAVRGTEFRSISNSQEALCWKLPFYAKTAASVAESGVRSMLRGDTEVTPGVMNRIFLKCLKPILPQRIHNLIAEIMWNPLEFPYRRKQSNFTACKGVERPQRTIIRPKSFRPTKQPRLLEFRLAEASLIEDLLDFAVADESANGTAVPVTISNITKETDGYISVETPIESTSTEVAPMLTDNFSSNNISVVEKNFTVSPTERDTKSPTEIELLLEQYKRHRSLDPFNDKQYFRDPRSSRLETFMNYGEGRY